MNNNSDFTTEYFDENSYFPYDYEIFDKSFAGKFNRGVVGISSNGLIEEYNLDDFPNLRHNIATYSVASDLGGKLDYSNNAYALGLAASMQGIIIIQYSDGIGLIYLPDEIMEKQYHTLKSHLESEKGIYEVVYKKNITYNKNEEKGSFIDSNSVLKFSKSIVSTSSYKSNYI